MQVTNASIKEGRLTNRPGSLINRPYHSRSLIRPDRVETLAAAISRQPARGCAPGGEEHIYVS